MVLFESFFGSTLFSSFFESGKNAFGTAFPVLKLTLQVWRYIASAACISLIVSILPLTATAQSSFRFWHTFKMVVCKLFVRTGYTSISLLLQLGHRWNNDFENKLLWLRSQFWSFCCVFYFFSLVEPFEFRVDWCILSCIPNAHVVLSVFPNCLLSPRLLLKSLS